MLPKINFPIVVDNHFAGFITSNTVPKNLREINDRIRKLQEIYLFSMAFGKTGAPIRIKINIALDILRKRIGEMLPLARSILTDHFKHVIIVSNSEVSTLAFSILMQQRMDAIENGRTSLIRTASNLTLQPVALGLIRAGADIDVKGRNGFTALMIASIVNNIAVATALIEAKANLEEVDHKGNSALRIALVKGHKELADKLIAANADVNNLAKSQFLFQAMAKGRLDIVTSLIESLGKVPTASHVTCALKAGKPHIVDYLLKKGAEYTAEDLCKYLDDLIMTGNKETQQHIEALKLLLAQRAGLNDNSSYHCGRTPLMLALMQGKLNIALLLTEYGSNMHASDAVGSSTFSYLSSYSSTQLGSTDEYATLAKVLSHALNPQGEAMQNDLKRTTTYGDTRLMDALIKAGVQVNCRFAGGKTPLMIAANNNRTKAASLLLTNGAYIEDVDDAGLNAIMYAAIRGHVDMLTLLVEANGNPHHVDKTGKSVLLHAAKWGRPEFIKALLSYNVDIKACNDEGTNVLMYAARYGFVTVKEEQEEDVKEQRSDSPSSSSSSSSSNARSDVPTAMSIAENHSGGKRSLSSSSGAPAAKRLRITQSQQESQSSNQMSDVGDGDGIGDGDGGASSNYSVAPGHRSYEGCLPLLLSTGININAQNKFGETALILAAKFGKLDAVMVLLQAGADKTLKNADGHTALELAVDERHEEIAKALS